MKRSWLGVALCAAGLSAYAVAEETPLAYCPPIDPPFFPAAAAPGGLRIFRDPATGQVRQPTAEEAARIAATAETLERQPAFEIVIHPDGMQSVDLREALVASIVITRGPDGMVTVTCLPPGARPAAPPGPPRASPALEEK